jgi:serine/threonine protein kinase
LPVGTGLRAGLYSVGKVLGQGGFGITYLGSDTHLKRPVAIKEFFPQIQGCVRIGTAVRPGGMITQAEFSEQRTKFLGEGQRLAQFQHPHIVKVFALFEDNNTAYMVMELLKGKTLLRIVEERGPLDEAEALEHITQVAEALSALHACELLHRDVKPENVIVTESRRAVLLDFGSAREFVAGKTRRMTTTLTPGYAPLEQYGQCARFGAPSDIYSLAATLYHLLTGKMPIPATDRASGVELRAPRLLNPKISSHVSSAVLSAMEVAVAARPQSMEEFLKALDRSQPPSGTRTNNDRARPNGASSAHPIPPKEAGGIIVNVDRTGSVPIDREVIVNVASAVAGHSIDRFLPCKSVSLSRKQQSWPIQLAPGQYRIWATCTVGTNEVPVFGTRVLESNELDLAVPPGNLPVNVMLGRVADRLYLCAGKPSVSVGGGGSIDKGAERGIVIIDRAGGFIPDHGVRLYFAQAVNGAGEPNQTHKSMKLGPLGKRNQSWRIELARGQYRISARCTMISEHVSASGAQFLGATKTVDSNWCDVVVPSGDRSVHVKLTRFVNRLLLTSDEAVAPTCKDDPGATRVSVVLISPCSSGSDVWLALFKTNRPGERVFQRCENVQKGRNRLDLYVECGQYLLVCAVVEDAPPGSAGSGENVRELNEMQFKAVQTKRVRIVIDLDRLTVREVS